MQRRSHVRQRAPSALPRAAAQWPQNSHRTITEMQPQFDATVYGDRVLRNADHQTRI